MALGDHFSCDGPSAFFRRLASEFSTNPAEDMSPTITIDAQFCNSDAVLAAGIRIPSRQNTVDPRNSITCFSKTVNTSVLFSFFGVVSISGIAVSMLNSIV